MIGRRVSAQISVDASGGTSPTKNFTPSDFTSVTGSSLSSSDAVVVTGYVHETDATFSRTGDPGADGTFEIDIPIESKTGGGETSGTNHIVTSDAGFKVSNDATSSQSVTVYGVRVDGNRVFVEQGSGVADGSEISRSVGSHYQEETIFELAVSGSSNVIRRHDMDDDGTFDTVATVNTISSLQTDKIPMMDYQGRTNVEMETALQASGSTRDLMILGTIGKQG